MIAICRPAFSPLSVLLVLLLIATWPGPCGAALSLTLDNVRHPAFQADDIEVHLATGHRGEADIRIGRVQFGEQEYRQVRLHCSEFSLDLERLDCPQGEIRRDDERGKDRPALPLALRYGFADGALSLIIAQVDAIAWSPLVKRLRSWQPQGKIDLVVNADRKRASVQLAARQLKFGSTDGNVAGTGIDLAVDAQARRENGVWVWQAKLGWPAGELFIAPWYRRAGIDVTAEGTLSEHWLDVAAANISLEHLGRITASLRWDRQVGGPDSFGFASEPLALEAAFRDWLQPWLDEAAIPKVQASGTAQFSGSWAQGRWQSINAAISEASVIDGTGFIDFSGINASIPWQRGAASDAEFSIASARLGDLPLGGFRIPLHLNDDQVRLDALSVPLLDGRLYIDELTATRHEEGWRGRFAGGMENISMPKLTHALKLPVMAGSFAVNVPAATYQDNVLKLGGAAAIQVFGGGILIDNLEVTDPLSESRRFHADVKARNLDLGMLTAAFSFGSILGQLDIDLTGLEMVGLEPIRFDARVESSPGDYRRAISRGALIDISSIGGAPGALAVGLSPARFFNTFDYERIGFTCALRDRTCEFDGIAPAGRGGYLLVKGRGIPSVRVVGYNRRIDWDLFVSRVRAVVAGKSNAVIE